MACSFDMISGRMTAEKRESKRVYRRNEWPLLVFELLKASHAGGGRFVKSVKYECEGSRIYVQYSPY